MTHPFEDDTAQYVVLANDRAQYSLWPADLTVPAGWEVVRGAASRQQALAFVGENWHDLRPAGQRKVVG